MIPDLDKIHGEAFYDFYFLFSVLGLRLLLELLYTILLYFKAQLSKLFED